MKTEHPAAVWLSGYHAIKRQVEALEKELDYLQSAATKATAKYGAAPTAKTGALDTMATLAVRSVDVEKSLLNTIEKLKASLDERLRLLDQLKSPDEKLILTMRYINCMSRPEIFTKAYYSERTAFRHHGSGLEHIWNLYQREGAFT